MLYAESIENTLRNENTRLTKELTDAQLDLEDARRSRRDLQQQLTAAEQRIGQFSFDCDSMRVGSSVGVAEHFLTSAES